MGANSDMGANAEQSRQAHPAPPAALTVYVAASFRHKHGVRLLGRELRSLGCHILDWTEKAVPPPGLTPAERRLWMDTDRAGAPVYAFCRNACLEADLLIYYGESGQDAGVEVGLAAGAGVPVLGIRGPLEGPGLMLHGAVSLWVDGAEEALAVLAEALRILGHGADGGVALRPGATDSGNAARNESAAADTGPAYNDAGSTGPDRMGPDSMGAASAFMPAARALAGLLQERRAQEQRAQERPAPATRPARC